MSRNDQRVLVQCIQLSPDGLPELGRVSTRHVRATDRAQKQSVTGQQQLFRLEVEAHRARRMTGGVQADTTATVQRLIMVQPVIGIGCRFIWNAEHLALCVEAVPQPPVVWMQPDRCARLFAHLPGSQKMILQTILHKGWKMQVSKNPDSLFLYNLRADPTEQNNLAEFHPVKIAGSKSLPAQKVQ